MTDSTPAWWAEVSARYGDLTGIAADHPGKGLANALSGNYHSDSGDTQGGLAQWVDDHRPVEPKE